MQARSLVLLVLVFSNNKLPDSCDAHNELPNSSDGKDELSNSGEADRNLSDNSGANSNLSQNQKTKGSHANADKAHSENTNSNNPLGTSPLSSTGIYSGAQLHKRQRADLQVGRVLDETTEIPSLFFGLHNPCTAMGVGHFQSVIDAEMSRVCHFDDKEILSTVLSAKIAREAFSEKLLLHKEAVSWLSL